LKVEAAAVPRDHLDLLQRPLVAALTTLLPDGRPQTQPVWFSYDPPLLLINTMRGFRKERNMRGDPRVTLLVVDPKDSSRWIEIRGDVELVSEGAMAHLDRLALRYAGVESYFGGCVDAALARTEFPVIGRVTPCRVVCDAIHRSNGPGNGKTQNSG
jgi:PPOX class probable F420-dependent enzyme